MTSSSIKYLKLFLCHKTAYDIIYTATKLRIIFVGSLGNGRNTTSSQRMHALSDLGHQIIQIDSCPIARSFAANTVSRVQRKLFRQISDPVLDQTIIKTVKKQEADILWIEKGLSISPQTLIGAKEIQRSIKIVGFSPDDMMNKNNQSKHFLKGLPFYDMYITTKSFGVDEIKKLGCKRVEFMSNGFDPALHRPIRLSEYERTKLGGPIGFIGTAECQRAESISFLAKNELNVKVWGDHWDKWKKRTKGNFDVAGHSQYGELYVKIICSFDINLCFLRKCNRDLQTTRSVEIPACGSFMLAERTDEHLALFDEGKEAEFFSSDEELLDKANYYLLNPDKRKKIAMAGRERCLRSGYSYGDRLKELLKIIGTL